MKIHTAEWRIWTDDDGRDGSDILTLLDEIDRLNAEIARLSDKYNALAYRVDL